MRNFLYAFVGMPTRIARTRIRNLSFSSNDARTERVRQMARRRGPISVVQRRIKRRLQELRKLALKEAIVDTKRVYLSLRQSPPNKHMVKE